MLEVIIILVVIALIPVALQVLLGLAVLTAWILGLPLRLLNWAHDKQVNSVTAMVVALVATVVFVALFGK
jgi:hypothetical protein